MRAGWSAINTPRLRYDLLAPQTVNDPLQVVKGEVQRRDLQLYIDHPGAFSQDVSALSHEIGEWMDDPLGSTPTVTRLLAA